MKVSVFGCGYLGAVHAAALASLGHDVVGVDVDEDKVALLARGETPFFEPGLDELLAAGIASGNLRFTTDAALAAGASVHFVCVGTPQSADGGSADLRFVNASVDAILSVAQRGSLIVGKSTVPVGTAAQLAERIEAAGVHLAWNPEFLREGYAVKDTLTPDRLVYGVRDVSASRAATLLDEVYHQALRSGTPRIVTDLATAELVKVAANAFLATKISFINAMAEIAEVTGADVATLADAIGHDERIGRKFLGAGVGFGGGCLPKDIRAFIARADELGTGESLTFLREVDNINLRRRDRVIDLVLDELGDDLTGHRIALLGLAFKPHSDDVRDSPALDIARRLLALGADVVATDPKAIDTAHRVVPDLNYVETAEEALSGSVLTILVTEWPEFRGMDPASAAALVSTASIIDARNALPTEAWVKAGWRYRGMGRHSTTPTRDASTLAVS